MSSFTVELVSNASFDCYPNNTLSSFTNFLPEQINLDGEWEVAITELSYPSLYQNITEGKFFYLDSSIFSIEKTPIKLHVNKITQRISLSLPNQNSLLSFLVPIFVMSLDAKKLFMVWVFS